MMARIGEEEDAGQEVAGAGTKPNSSSAVLSDCMVSYATSSKSATSSWLRIRSMSRRIFTEPSVFAIPRIKSLSKLVPAAIRLGCN